MYEIIHRELIYIWYYFDVQLRNILFYWIFGMAVGSFISVFAKDRIHKLFSVMQGKNIGLLGLIPASILGILSPLCMYGTIPIAASFSKKGMRHDWLAAFMMSSILLNPQLMMYSLALGPQASIIRLLSSLLCGIAAGILVHIFYGRHDEKIFFDFKGFESSRNRDTDPNYLIRYLKNLGRNIKVTAKYFLLGILLSALFQRYVPSNIFAQFFGTGNRGFGLLMAATIGVPLYVCGGGTIPLLQQWLFSGMSLGSAASFMITGPATKITNLGALKIVLGAKKFGLYLLFVILFSLLTGFVVNLVI